MRGGVYRDPLGGTCQRRFRNGQVHRFRIGHIRLRLEIEALQSLGAGIPLSFRSVFTRRSKRTTTSTSGGGPGFDAHASRSERARVVDSNSEPAGTLVRITPGGLGRHGCPPGGLCRRDHPVGVSGIRHLRTYDNRQEVDLIVERPDQRILVVEIKLSSTIADGDVAHLAWLKDKIKSGILCNSGSAGRGRRLPVAARSTLRPGRPAASPGH